MSRRYRLSLWTDQGPNSFELSGTSVIADEQIDRLWTVGYGESVSAMHEESAHSVLAKIEDKRAAMIKSEDSMSAFLFQTGNWKEMQNIIEFTQKVRDACRDFPGALIKVETID